MKKIGQVKRNRQKNLAGFRQPPKIANETVSNSDALPSHGKVTKNDKSEKQRSALFI